MEFNIDKDRKREIIDALIEASITDIYRYALSLNIAPESLTVNWEPPTDSDYNENEVNFLLKALGRLASLQARRDSL